MAKTGAFWGTSPENFGLAVHGLVNEKTRETAVALFDMCVKLSPVDSGAYRASWNISQDYPDYKWVGRQPRHSGPLPPHYFDKHQLSTKFYRMFYVSNGAPYALKIEEGSSDFAPFGVMRRAIKAVS